MSGHSKWHSIRHKKGANDLKRGKVLTKHAKILAVVGRDNPDPEKNPALRAAIANAKADSVPKDNIERILKKLSGEGKDAAIFVEQVYEGYAPGGIPFIVTALTDNGKRTFPQVRTAVEKNGGKLGGEGSVQFLFDHVGIVLIKSHARGGHGAEKSEDALFEIAIECGADDFYFDSDESEIVTSFANLARVRDALTEKGIEVVKSEPQYRAKESQIISEASEIERLEKFINVLEEIDDVDEVFIGFEGSE